MDPTRLAAIFNEWLRRYVAKPNDFRDMVDAEGKPMPDYGTHCAEYFLQLDRELHSAPPKPFWEACGLCGKPIALQSEAELIWVGSINGSGGKSGYVHAGGKCLSSPPKNQGAVDASNQKEA